MKNKIVHPKDVKKENEILYPKNEGKKIKAQNNVENKTKESSNLNKVDLKKSKKVRRIEQMEVEFDHINLESKYNDTKSVLVEIYGIEYFSDLKVEEVKQIINEAVEHFYNLKPIKSADIPGFIKFVQERYGLEIEKIESMEFSLQKTLTLER